MNNLEIAHELNVINNFAKGKVLKQVIGSLILGFFAGVPDDVYNKIFDFHLKIKTLPRETELDKNELAKNLIIISKLDNLFTKITDEKSKLIIGVFTLSIAYNKLTDFRNILAHLNKHIETLDFRNDISSQGMTLH